MEKMLKLDGFAPKVCSITGIDKDSDSFCHTLSLNADSILSLIDRYGHFYHEWLVDGFLFEYTKIVTALLNSNRIPPLSNAISTFALFTTQKSREYIIITAPKGEVGRHA